MPSRPPSTQRQEASCLSHECDDCRQFLASYSQNTMRMFKGALTRSIKSPQASPRLAASKPSSTISINSIDSKDSPSPDDSDDMSSPTGSTSSRPHSSQGPRSHSQERHRQNHYRRPTLKQIMADEAEAPWTLSAFTRYASQNLCLENIQFIQDAQQYCEIYTAAQSSHSSRTDEHPGLLIKAWQTILSTYILPGSPREVNISGDVRAAIVGIPSKHVPPSPELLLPAIHKVYELIEDSILFSFFSDVRPQERSAEHDQSLPERTYSNRRSPVFVDSIAVSFAPSPMARRTRISGPSPSSTSQLHDDDQMLSRHSHAASSSSSISNPANNSNEYSSTYCSYTAFTDVVDDNGSAISPANLASPTLTNTQSGSPPVSPPASDHELGFKRASPRSKSGNWQKFSKLFGKNSATSRKGHKNNENAIQEEE